MERPDGPTLPGDPTLAAVAVGGVTELAPVPLGVHTFGPEAVEARRRWRNGPNDPVYVRSALTALGGWLVQDTPGGPDELREHLHPALRDMVDGLPASDDRSAITWVGPGTGLQGKEVGVLATAVRIREPDGRLAGTAVFMKPAPGMAVLAAVGALGDLAHFERMQRVTKPARRPAAVLFADLEAFFLAETAGSESAAARSCIAAARALRDRLGEVAASSGLEAQDVVVRFGLHWGATLYVGQITTRGRAEVTAMGDEVNETARIEACAAGGRALASKALVERLDSTDAQALGLDPDRLSYTRLGDLPTATEKARRDAPAIAVCEV